MVSIPSGSLGFLTIVSSNDYEQSATLEQGGVTLQRIIGGLSIVETAVSQVGMAIYMLDEGFTPAVGGVGDVLVFSQLIRGDLLWHRILAVDTVRQHIEFDVRARRRLEDASVHLCVSNGGPGTLTVVSHARALIAGG